MAADFIGKGWSFPPHFNKYEQNVEIVSEKEEIEESLKILFSTRKGERLFHPDYGCDLKQFQFAPSNTGTLLLIRRMVEIAIRKFEPRITLNDVDVNLDGLLEGKIIIDLIYTINATNSRYNMVYPYCFE